MIGIAVAGYRIAARGGRLHLATAEKFFPRLSRKELISCGVFALANGSSLSAGLVLPAVEP